MAMTLRMGAVYEPAGRHATRFSCCFDTLTLAFLSASTGQRLQRDFDRQHFFLTLPAFVHFAT